MNPSPNPPPRFLLGCAALFWGAMTEHVVIGVLLALIVEAAYFLKLRWNFDDTAYARAWHLSALAIFVTLVMFLLENDQRRLTMPRLMGWLPVLLIPIQFAQSYGLRNSIPLNIFSFFARKRRERNLRLGLQESVIHLNFGNVYLVVTILASTLGPQASPYVFLPGIVLLIGWPLSLNRSRKLASILIALFLATIFAIGGQLSLGYAVGKFSKYRQVEASNQGLDARSSRTRIGQLGEVKGSENILWRMQVHEVDPFPKLIRAASYNRYRNGVWSAPIPPDVETLDLDFLDLRVEEGDDGEDYYIVRGEAQKDEAISSNLPRFTLIGSVKLKSLLPMPGDASSLTGFELDGIEQSSLGTVRLYPQNPVIEGTVLWGAQATPETAPWELQDLSIPQQEQQTLQQVVDDLGLEQIPDLDRKLRVLRDWFSQNFRYTRYLSIPPIRGGDLSSRTAISTFLTSDRKGHCEYFATAATLLLRQAGIPARYSMGFSVQEIDSEKRTAILRGKSLHAWSRVWDEKSARWIDFDPTPSDWFSIESKSVDQSSFQWFSDWMHTTRENFFLWRNRPKNQLIIGIVVSILAIGALIVIVRRLAKSRHRLTVQEGSTFFQSNIRTPLHGLESTAKKILGERQTGQTFSHWLGQLRSSMPDSTTLDEALTLHQQLRFDPEPAPDATSSRLEELTEELRGRIDRISSEAKA